MGRPKSTRGIWVSDPNKPLSAKQKMFADYYVEMRNATQAARLAGYSGGGTSVTGYRLRRLAQVAAYIETRTQEMIANNKATNSQVIREIEALAMGDLGQIKPQDKLKALNLLTKVLGLQIDNVKIEHTLSDEEVAKRINTFLSEMDKK